MNPVRLTRDRSWARSAVSQFPPRTPRSVPRDLVEADGLVEICPELALEFSDPRELDVALEALQAATCSHAVKACKQSKSWVLMPRKAGCATTDGIHGEVIRNRTGISLPDSNLKRVASKQIGSFNLPK